MRLVSPARAAFVPLALVLLYGAVLRSWQIDVAPLWTDEAESSLNALTILRDGVPGNTYLGLPLFENTLTRPWPDHPEYEFRDSSYSDRGLVVYHGWLPLYAIAASFALHGIQPDDPGGELTVRRGASEMRRLTLAARLPSLVFGLAFLVATFMAGRELYGTDAGWAALSAATVSTTVVSLTRQARYYSLTLAIGALCALSFARIVRHGERRDFVLGGVSMTLLFHTHVLAFVSACAAASLLVPVLVRRRIGFDGPLWFTAIVLAGTIPWIVTTGFLASAADLPRAFHLLDLRDVAEFARRRWPFVAIAVAALGCLFVLRRIRIRVPARIAAPFDSAQWMLWFLAGWAVVAFSAFTMLVPAASHFHSRLTLLVLVPSLLFGSVLAAALARACSPRFSPWVASAFIVVLLAGEGKATFWWPDTDDGQPPLFSTIEYLRSAPIRPGTRLYATAGGSLPLMLYSGLPVQNVMPIRRSFLDGFEGDVLVIETPDLEPLSWMEAAEVLAADGAGLGEQEARRVARRFNEHITRQPLLARVTSVAPGPPDEPAFSVLAPIQQRKTELAIQRVVADSGNPMFKGYSFAGYTSLWQIFFYRFVNPESRMGEHLNYAARIRDAEGVVLPGGWAVIHSRARNSAGHSF